MCDALRSYVLVDRENYSFFDSLIGKLKHLGVDFLPGNAHGWMINIDFKQKTVCATDVYHYLVELTLITIELTLV